MDKTQGDSGTPWGFWPTMGFSLIIMILFIMTQVGVVLAFSIYGKFSSPGIDPDLYQQSVMGFSMAVSTIISAPLCSGLIVLFCIIRKNYPLIEYLCLKKIKLKTFSRLIVLSLAFVAVSDGITHLFNRPVVPDFMIEMYKTAYVMPLLYIALIIGAPLFEELFFRGFLFKGVCQLKAGTFSQYLSKIFKRDFSRGHFFEIAAILFTAFAWAIIHLQYDLYGMVHIFVFGIILGFVRLKTGSIYATIVMHALVNLVATIEVAVFMKYYLLVPALS